MVIALNKVSGKKIRIIGHTDSSGDANKNIVLSQQRAEAVKNYLISKNIAAENLSVDGLGSTQPIADNLTAEGRKKNRRIEFEVLLSVKANKVVPSSSLLHFIIRMW